MSAHRAPLVGLALLSVLLLAACATPAPEQTDEAERRAAYELRAAKLAGWTDWGLSGRLGIELDGDGGSGRITWALREQDSELSFRGALGQGAWRLRSDPRGAVLSRTDGTESRAASVNELVRRELGWPVPVAALSWWVRGLAAPGAEQSTRVQLGPDGLPRTISEADWQVSFERWTAVDGQQLPRRVEASDGQIRVRLAVSGWWFDEPAVGAANSLPMDDHDGG